MVPNPPAPDNAWRLIAEFDTDDGPRAWWVRPMQTIDCTGCAVADGTHKPAQCLHQIAEPAAVHPDEVAVDALAALMKAKLAKQRAKGYGGWNDKIQCPQQRLSTFLRTHVDKGDPVDVANFCAMLSARGEGITAQATPLPLLLRDIARDLGVTVPEACVAHKPWGDYSTNSAVTAEMAVKLREAFPNPAPQTVQVTEEMRVCNSEECGWIGPLPAPHFVVVAKADCTCWRNSHIQAVTVCHFVELARRF